MNSNISRRQTLKLLGGTGLVAASGLSLGQNQAPAPSGNGNGFYRFKLGEFTITILGDGTAPVAQVLPTWGANPDRQDEFRRTLEENFLPVQNGINTFSPVLVDTGRSKILLDTGRGGTAGQMLAALRNAGVAPADINTVFITHGHGDHIGGITTSGAPTFPNARMVMGDAEFAFWTGQANPSAAVQANLIALRDRYTLIKDGQEIAPGLTAVASPGHTAGHLSVRISSGNANMMAFGDAAGHFILSLRHPGSFLTFDTNGAQAAQTRTRLFEQAAAERMLITAYHFPFPSVGYIRKRDNYFEFVPAVWSWS